MRHLRHIATVAVALVAIAAPVLAADPAMRSLVVNHPALAAYFPLVSGLVSALVRAYTASRVDTAAVSSNGSPTMGAK